MNCTLRLVAIALTGVILSVVGISGTASAEPVRQSTGRIAMNVPAETGGNGAVCGQSGSIDTYLPINRWSNVNDLHSDLKSGITHIGDMIHAANRSSTQTVLNLGDVMWGVAAGVMGSSNTFCPLYAVAAGVDNIVADLSGAAISTGIIGLIVAVGLVMAIRNPGQVMKRLVSTFALAIIFVVMSQGASGTTNTGQTATRSNNVAGTTAGDTIVGGNGTVYHFGRFSPGWFVTKADSAVTSFANKFASAFVTTGNNTGSEADAGCGPYVKSLHQQYMDAGGSSEALMMSALWETQGLSLWEKAQYGDNGYGQYDYCHQLDSNAAMNGVGVTPADGMVAAANASAPLGYTTYANQYKTAQAWRMPTDDDDANQQIIGWMACQTGNYGFDKNTKDKSDADFTNGQAGQLKADCEDFFTNPGNTNGNAWDWSDSDDINDALNTGDITPKEADMLLNLRGSRQSIGMGTAIFYVFVSMISAAVFVIFGLAIIIIKLGLAFFGIRFMWALLKSLISSEGLDAVVKEGKKWCSMAVLGFGVGLILSLIVVFTHVLISVGIQIGNSFFQSIWNGFAPVIACFLLMFIFKATGASNPMSIKGALAVAEMAAAGEMVRAPGQAWRRMRNNQMMRAMAGRGRGGRGGIMGRFGGGRRGSRPGGRMEDSAPTEKPSQQQTVPMGPEGSTRTSLGARAAAQRSHKAGLINTDEMSAINKTYKDGSVASSGVQAVKDAATGLGMAFTAWKAKPLSEKIKGGVLPLAGMRDAFAVGRQTYSQRREAKKSLRFNEDMALSRTLRKERRHQRVWEGVDSIGERMYTRRQGDRQASERQRVTRTARTTQREQEARTRRRINEQARDKRRKLREREANRR